MSGDKESLPDVITGFLDGLVLAQTKAFHEGEETATEETELPPFLSSAELFDIAGARTAQITFLSNRIISSAFAYMQCTMRMHAHPSSMCRKPNRV